ncbi:glycosyltransferase family 87 protein [Shimia sp.]|uniref:glycosyltransferase family 87 protein n=1 Tax=Shimia sp. TaxID=1954381 RepID=UPI0032997143
MPRMTRQRVLLLYAGCAALALLVTVLSGIRHDYFPYLLQWKAGLASGDPWISEYNGNYIPPNAYGPLHALFAKLLIFGDFGPKITFTLITLTCPALLLVSAPKDAQQDRLQHLQTAILLLVCTPIVSITVFVFGINDGVVGFLVLAACVARSRGWHATTGMIIGLAALLKFYPLLFAPFLAVGLRGKIRFRVLIFAAITFALGMYAAYLYWGASVLNPLLFGSSRGAKHLSFLQFLDWSKDVLHIVDFTKMLIRINSYVVILVTVAIAIWGWATRQTWDLVLLLGIMAIFVTYKVGHAQFYVSWIVVHTWVLLASPDARAVAVARAFVPVAVFLSLYQVAYLISGVTTGYYFEGTIWSLFRHLGSLVMLPLVFRSLWMCRHDLTSRRKRA